MGSPPTVKPGCTSLLPLSLPSPCSTLAGVTGLVSDAGRSSDMLSAEATH